MTEPIEFEFTDSHAERLRELEDEMDDDVRRELALQAMQAVDDTYREVML